MGCCANRQEDGQALDYRRRNIDDFDEALISNNYNTNEINNTPSNVENQGLARNAPSVIIYYHRHFQAHFITEISIIMQRALDL